MTNKAKIFGNDRYKFLRSETYNYNFDLETGDFQRWGKTMEDDPWWSPFGPEIMDIEVSSGAGCPVSCKFCYKGNMKGETPTNMSLETFRKIFRTFPKTVTQIAFGITSVNTHPELFDIFQHCRENRVIPNVTINGSDELSDETIVKLVKVCGAMAVSVVPPNQERAYDLIQRFTDAGAKQINIHYVISKQSIEEAYKVCDAIKNDPRLSKMKAIVFLGLKPKNRGQAYDILPVEEFVKLVNHCLDHDVAFGFDSCSAPKFDAAVQLNQTLSDDQKTSMLQCSERCESGLFSAYIDATGKYWHCSFGEDREDAYGIDVTTIKNFTKDVWLSHPMMEWRRKLLDLNRECPLYPEIRVEG